MISRIGLGIAALTFASGASAQWVPGMEITGQQVQVETNGVLNTVTFDRGGVAHISSPSGATVVDATWTASNGKICLQTSTTSDCYPYQAPFVAHQTVDLVSDCGVRSEWTPLSTFVEPTERG